jgi:hypothetical protein
MLNRLLSFKATPIKRLSLSQGTLGNDTEQEGAEPTGDPNYSRLNGWSKLNESEVLALEMISLLNLLPCLSYLLVGPLVHLPARQDCNL